MASSWPKRPSLWATWPCASTMPGALPVTPPGALCNGGWHNWRAPPRAALLDRHRGL